MLAQERKRLILEILSKSKSVVIEELSKQMEVSEMTIRRDLLALEQAGLLTRTHGGAVNAPAHFLLQPSFGDKEEINHQEKKAIGVAAAHLVKDGDTIGLGCGTTCFQVAKNMDPALRNTVVTNAVNIAMELSNRLNTQLIVTGGLLLPQSFALADPFAEDIFKRIHMDKFFLGATGVSLDVGITTQMLQEASLYRAMAGASQEIIVVADYSKFNLVTLAPILEMNCVTRLVTDLKTPPELLEKVAALGVDVIVADSSQIES
jgi:DeoR/GlpR family transcriptional regulator of sugar metabolism